MNNSANYITIPQLLMAFIPVFVVMCIFVKWKMNVKTLIYASLRMIIQLIVVGYALIVIFGSSDVFISSGILFIMLIISAWIALRPIKNKRKKYYLKTLFSLFAGGVPVLILVVFCVVRLQPWFMPRYLIPLAGMIFANGMNSISLCAERLYSELQQGKSFNEARPIAYSTALLPLINSYFAVGLVSLPGMMTGQILSGISPLLAVRYQIMVMCMLLGSCGISSAIFLSLFRHEE